MSSNYLQRAQNLTLPSREDMLIRSPAVQQFWEQHSTLLSKAWGQWEGAENEPLFALDDSLLDDKLREAVTQAWQNPSQEVAVQHLLSEVAPGVYEFQLFNPERLADFRAYLENIWDADIPLRPPYGIVLNRRGAMLDPRSTGYLAAPSFQRFYSELLDNYMRPIARMLFPEIVGFDTQTFGFSIHYQPSTDTSIRTHTDASSVTLNVNLNVPGESFTGSEVDFLSYTKGIKKRVSFKPGMAMIHRGNVPHAAQPIISGERTNLVLWLYGDKGRIPGHGQQEGGVDAKLRWSLPTSNKDTFAPF